MSESMFGKSTHHLKLSPSSEPLDVSHSLLSDPTTPHQSSKSNRKSAASSRYTSANSLPALSPHSLNPDQPADIKLPDLLVVSGLENAQSPAQIKLLSIVHSSRLEYDDSTYEAPEGWMSIWVRDADGPEVPSWVVSRFSSARLDSR